MTPNSSSRAPEAEAASLNGYYIIGLTATTIGICVVFLLNMLTPLESIQAQVRFITGDEALNWVIFFKRFLPRLAAVLAAAYLLTYFAIRILLAPVAGHLQAIREGRAVAPGEAQAAKRRLLNLPFLFTPINVGMWLVFPAAIACVAYLSGRMDSRTAITLAARSSMVGLIATMITLHKMEAFSRVRLIPLFFPEGRLSDIRGAARFSVSKRIRLVNRLGNLIPMTIFIVTFLTLQWEVAEMDISAIDYGKGILTFMLALFTYTVLASSVLNREVSRSITRPLDRMVHVLKGLRQGDFTRKVLVVSNDEIGYTAEVINEMVDGLKEREQMRQSLELAREVQQNLLPTQAPSIPGLDIAARSIFCDETGGDYYDFIQRPDSLPIGVGVAMGDVSGHGISAALLMATARAFLKQRACMPGGPAEVVSDVNRHLSRDVGQSGSFMTLFYLEIDRVRGCLRWARAGHDPGLLFDPVSARITDLQGEGIALCLDETHRYREQHLEGLAPGQVIVLFTDGVLEARNRQGEMFGKTALKSLIRDNAQLGARDLLNAVVDSLQRFRQGAAVEDDVTLLVVKIGELTQAGDTPN